MTIWEVCYLNYDDSVCYGFYSTADAAESRRQALVKANREFWTAQGESYTEGGRDEQYTVLEHELDEDCDKTR